MSYVHTVAKMLVSSKCRAGLYQGIEPAICHPLWGIALIKNNNQLLTDQVGIHFYGQLGLQNIEVQKETFLLQDMAYRNSLSQKETNMVIQDDILNFVEPVPDISLLVGKEGLSLEDTILESMDFYKKWKDEYPLFVGVYRSMPTSYRANYFLKSLQNGVWCLDWELT